MVLVLACYKFWLNCRFIFYIKKKSQKTISHLDITPKKVLISFKIDADILAIMKATGKGYQTRMNKYLREAVTEGRF